MEMSGNSTIGGTKGVFIQLVIIYALSIKIIPFSQGKDKACECLCKKVDIQLIKAHVIILVGMNNYRTETIESLA